jgi:hypothetical protein
VKASFEGTRRFLAAQVEQELCGGEEENGAPGENRAMRDVLGDHRFAEASRRDEDDVASAFEKIKRRDRFDERPIDGRRPVPVEVGERTGSASAFADPRSEFSEKAL